MNFTELKTKITSLLDRSDYDTKVGGYINSAIHELEQDFDWRQMEAKATGNLTSIIDYIAIPARYKNTKSLIITDSSNSNKQIVLTKKDYLFMIAQYPYGSDKKDTPKTYATKTSESNFVVRPYPDKTYAYELITNNFSADLVVTTNESNYWMTDMWKVVYYGSLIQYELDSGKRIVLGTEEAPITPTIFYKELLSKLKNNQINERKSRAQIYESVDYVV